MSLGSFKSACILLGFCAILVGFFASTLAQQKTATESDLPPGTAATPPSDFEVKIDKGEFLVRRKGTPKWKRSSEVSEPIAVGLLEGGHKIYVGTKALKPPKAIHTEDPDYPSGERESRVEGLVSMRVVVDDHGSVRGATVDYSSGLEFSNSAVLAVKKWTFQPAQLNGQPVAALVIVAMQFKLY